MRQRRGLRVMQWKAASAAPLAYACVASLALAAAPPVRPATLLDMCGALNADEKAPAQKAEDNQAKPAETPKTNASATTEMETAPAPAGRSELATYLLARDPLHNDPTILWDGFLNGLRGFEHFYEPVGNPLYFESPFNTSGLRLLYLYHDFPDGSQIGGGSLNVFAMQARVALTERLGFIATKDGYSLLDAAILPEADGWNNIAAGLKYVIIADRENDFVLTAGSRWEWTNGDTGVIQSETQELSPFVSFAKGFNQFHILGNVTGRLPMDRHNGNYILSWDLHFDYEIAPKELPGFAPIFEIHGLHYLSDGDRLPLAVGGADYTNLGSTDVAGSSVFWAGVGFRWKLTPHVSIGSTWEFPLSNPNDDIFGQRVTADMMLTW